MAMFVAFQAVVRPQKAQALFERLHQLPGVVDCEACEVRGTGHQTRHLGRAVLGFLPKVAIGGVVDADHTEELIELIRNICPTGRSGDGKVFLLPIHAALDLEPAE